VIPASGNLPVLAPVVSEVTRSLDERLATVPELWRRALIAEAKLRSGERGALSEWPPVPLKHEHLPLLLAFGENVVDFEPAERAAEEVLRTRPALGAFECERLIYPLHSRERNARSALQSFDRMLRLAGRAFERDWMLAVLIEFPDGACGGRIASVAVNPQTPFSPAELARLWVAAALVGDGSARTIA